MNSSQYYQEESSQEPQKPSFLGRIFSYLQNMPRQRLAISVLVILLVVAGVLAFSRQIFKASNSDYTISGVIYGQDTKQRLDGATLTLTSTQPDDPPVTVTSHQGDYTLTIPSANYIYLTIAKDGYYDIDAFLFKAGLGSNNLNLALKPGFGKQSAEIVSVPDNDTGYFATSLQMESSIPDAKQIVPAEEGYTEAEVPLEIYDTNSGDFVTTDIDPKTEEGVTPKLGQVLRSTRQGGTYIFYGTPRTDQIAVGLNGNGKESYAGNPHKVFTNVSDIKVKINNEEANLKEAADKNWIKPEISFSDGSGNISAINIKDNPLNDKWQLTPGNFLKLTANQPNTMVVFPEIKNLNIESVGVEIPEDITAEEAEWAFWVDRKNLSDEEYAIWADIANRLLSLSIKEVNSKSQNNNTSQSGDYYIDYQIDYLKNSKIIPDSFEPGTQLPPVPNKIKLSNISATAKPSIDQCAEKPYLEICADNFNIKDTVSQPWTDQENMRLMLNQFSSAYPLMEKYYGTPFFINQNTKQRVINAILSAYPLEGRAAFYDNKLKIIVLNKSIAFRSPSGLCTITHEILHAWRDNPYYNKKFLLSWEEGQTYLIAGRIMEDLKKVSPQYYHSDYFFEENQDIMYLPWGSNMAVSDFMWHFQSEAIQMLPRIGLSIYSWGQLLEKDISIFSKYGAELPKTNYDINIAMKNATSQINKFDFKTWYNKQYGLQQLIDSQPSSYKPQNYFYRFSNYGSKIYNKIYPSFGEFFIVSINKDHYINVSSEKVNYQSDIYKTNKQGYVQTISKQNACGNIEKKYICNVLYLDPENNQQYYVGQKYLNVVTNKNPDGKIISDTIFTAQYKSEDSGIYGIVSELNSGNISITPISPKSLTSKNITVSNGYFESKDVGNDYGWDAGEYLIEYKNLCGDTQRYSFIKDTGNYFIAIRTEKSNNSQKDLCYSKSLEIKNISYKTLADGSVNVTFSTSIPAFISRIEWGLDNKYSQPFDESFKDQSNETFTEHSLVFKNVTLDQLYHYRFVAISADGRPDPKLLSNIIKGINHATTESVESGDQTFTPKNFFKNIKATSVCKSECGEFSISDIKPGDITTGSANISWKTNKESTDTLEYGLDTNYGTTVDAGGGLSKNVPLASLPLNTTYHYRIKADFGDGKIFYSKDYSFTTQNMTIDGARVTASDCNGQVMVTWNSLGSNISPNYAPLSESILWAKVDYDENSYAVATYNEQEKRFEAPLSDLEPNHEYYFTVSVDVYSTPAVNLTNNVDPSPYTTTSAIENPNLTCLKIGNVQYEASWMKAFNLYFETNFDATGYVSFSHGGIDYYSQDIFASDQLESCFKYWAGDLDANEYCPKDTDAPGLTVTIHMCATDPSKGCTTKSFIQTNNGGNAPQCTFSSADAICPIQ